MADRMEKVNMPKEFANLNDVDKHFVKKIESMNNQRATSLKALRRKNLITVGLLGAGVMGIYFYSMFAVKQEKFLDDFDVPGGAGQTHLLKRDSPTDTATSGSSS